MGYLQRTATQIHDIHVFDTDYLLRSRHCSTTHRPDGVLREQRERRASQDVNDAASATNVALARNERPDGDLNSGPWLRKPRG